MFSGPNAPLRLARLFSTWSSISCIEGLNGLIRLCLLGPSGIFCAESVVLSKNGHNTSIFISSINKSSNIKYVIKQTKPIDSFLVQTSPGKFCLHLKNIVLFQMVPHFPFSSLLVPYSRTQLELEVPYSR